MHLKFLASPFIFCLLCLYGIAGTKKDSLTPTNATWRSERESYHKCRKDVLLKLGKGKKKNKKNLKRAKKSIQNCRAMFPESAALTLCRKRAFKDFKDRANYIPTALKECRHEYKKMRFSPQAYQPIRRYRGYIIFAGANLADTRYFSKKQILSSSNYSLNTSYFDCNKLKLVLTKKEKPEYLLFGNRLSHYIPLSNIPFPKLRQHLEPKLTKNTEDITHKTLGLLHFNKKDNNIISYLPSTPCSFQPDAQSPFEAVKLYYIPDVVKKTATPYFAIAFYKENSKIPLSQLTEEVSRELGDSFQVIRGKGDMTFIAEKPIQYFDHEGDPKDLCKFPREHSLVAAIASKQEYARYLLLSNIRNQCNMGDRLASRFLRKASK